MISVPRNMISVHTMAGRHVPCSQPPLTSAGGENIHKWVDAQGVSESCCHLLRHSIPKLIPACTRGCSLGNHPASAWAALVSRRGFCLQVLGQTWFCWAYLLDPTHARHHLGCPKPHFFLFPLFLVQWGCCGAACGVLGVSPSPSPLPISGTHARGLLLPLHAAPAWLFLGE